MAQAVYRFYAFVETRYGAWVREAVARPVVCPVDEFNRPRRLARVGVRIPPSAQEVEFLFTAWRYHLPSLRGTAFLTAARDYVAESLWRRLGLRINETVRLRAGDWYPHAGTYGILHVRCGKGARGSGPRERLVPPIDGTDRLLAWWLTEVRSQFGDESVGGQAVLLPSRQHTLEGGRRPACTVTLRDGDGAAPGAAEAATIVTPRNPATAPAGATTGPGRSDLAVPGQGMVPPAQVKDPDRRYRNRAEEGEHREGPRQQCP
ncbi:hypothetical protein HEP84_54345 [Streptomyces sp. RLB1-33]|nr:hypothetical protein [Streptomyces sp. RLB1-33]QIY76485.1 hypothetical protein HEP84_54345 [Streptomyces sp. RLB1-33]